MSFFLKRDQDGKSQKICDILSDLVLQNYIENLLLKTSLGLPSMALDFSKRPRWKISKDLKQRFVIFPLIYVNKIILKIYC